MFLRCVDIDLIDCLTFYWLGYSDHEIFSARITLGPRDRMSVHWIFNVSLLDRRAMQRQLTRLVQAKIVGWLLGISGWNGLRIVSGHSKTNIANVLL